jgi:DNA ligase-1
MYDERADLELIYLSLIACQQFTTMSSPAKKRKTNKYEASSQPVRGLDYFFAKQKDAAKAKPIVQPATKTAEKLPDLNGGSSSSLTDEELARKLQEEWDREDGATTADGNSSSHPIVTETAQHQDGTEDHKELGDATVPIAKQTLPFFEKAKSTLSLQSTATDEDIVTAMIPFDESPLTFKPSKYIPELQKTWALDGGHVTYALLTRCFVLVNGTTSRIKIVDTLVNMLRTIIESDPDSLLPAVSRLFLSFDSFTEDRLGMACYERHFTAIHRP